MHRHDKMSPCDMDFVIPHWLTEFEKRISDIKREIKISSWTVEEVTEMIDRQFKDVDEIENKKHVKKSSDIQHTWIGHSCLHGRCEIQ